MAIHNELRQNEQGETEVWANLGDILNWLATLPEQTDHLAAAGVALEIRQMLLDQLGAAVQALLLTELRGGQAASG